MQLDEEIIYIRDVTDVSCHASDPLCDFEKHFEAAYLCTEIYKSESDCWVLCCQKLTGYFMFSGMSPLIPHINQI